ncbi:MAG: glucuronate isomerase [Chloroflexales bacterium]|nr:glucuronate isomerase [Chloroflexales bacterium]
MTPWQLSPDRCFDPNPAQRALARSLYDAVKDLPIVSPHGHVSPALLADPAATLGTPADLFVIPDHYVFRMLYSQGVPLEDLGIATRATGLSRDESGPPVETDHRRIWQRFADHFHLFRATPTGLWLQDELMSLFGVTEKLTGASAQRIYDQVAARLAQPEFAPRALFTRFNIEVLCTTDPATSELEHHQALRAAGWGERVRPTFRPDAVVNIDTQGWGQHIAQLGKVSGIEITGYDALIRALEQRRAFFKAMGAVATDHAAPTPYTQRLTLHDAEAIMGRALRGAALPDDAARFTGHMLVELARMGAEDGLVMQLHVGSQRNHNAALFDRFGPDMGADIPAATEYTRNLRPLLNEWGSDARLRLILFTLDEATYGRELAPLAGHYPALRLGPPWWFFDSVAGMRRFLDSVVETAGLRNLAGFNDDTRAFCSIPARHDVWRRASCDWLAGQSVRGLIDEDDAAAMAHECAYGLARRAYRLGGD